MRNTGQLRHRAYMAPIQRRTDRNIATIPTEPTSDLSLFGVVKYKIGKIVDISEKICSMLLIRGNLRRALTP